MDTMTLAQVLSLLTGRYELTVMSPTIQPHTYTYYAQDEEVPSTDCTQSGSVDFADYINYYDVIKTWAVNDIHVTENRNLDGAAVWIEVENR